jgi:hypothetical protein
MWPTAGLASALVRLTVLRTTVIPGGYGGGDGDGGKRGGYGGGDGGGGDGGGDGGGGKWLCGECGWWPCG